MKNHKILIIDDISFMRQILKDTLKMNEDANIEIDEAKNGQEAQEQLKKNSYDLILCDYLMPDMNGNELLQWVRADSTLSKIPFILITSMNDIKYMKESIQIGVTDYIVKPIVSKILNERIRMAIHL